MQLLFCFALAVPLFGSGCGNRESAGAEQSRISLPSDPVDVVPLKKAFRSASPVLQLGVDDTIEEIRARHFKVAVQRLQNLLDRPELTDQQRQTVREIIARLKPLDARHAQ